VLRRNLAGRTNLMSEDFKISFDLTELTKEFKYFKDIEKRVSGAIDVLAAQAYGQAIKLVQQQIRSQRNLYLENLEFTSQGSGDNKVWLIILHENAMWIEEGSKAHTLQEVALKGGAKSRVIPFNNNKNIPSMSSDKQKSIQQDVKKFLNTQKISLNKPIGSVAGKVASFNKVPSKTTSKHSGESVLNRMNLYQTKTISKTGKSTTHTTAMTFRTLSADGTDWNIPEYKAKKILDQTYDWILTNYEKIVTEQLQLIVVKGN
jgi:hypothetical protein